jgi:hypothetical protein
MDRAKLPTLEDTGGMHSGHAQQGSCLRPVFVTKDISGLGAVKSRGVALAIWQRTLPRDVQQWLDTLPATTLPNQRILVRPDDFRRAVTEILDGCEMPATDHREFLIGDMNRLILAFARICEITRVDARIEALSNDACWKYHRDCVELRLVATYRGPATEWVTPEHGEAALREQKVFQGPVQKLACGDVAIFKGTETFDEDGIVHRSPPIAGSGTTRLLLCLNAPSNASPKLWALAGRNSFLEDPHAR